MILIPSVEDEVFAQVDQSCKCNISHQCLCACLLLFLKTLLYREESEMGRPVWDKMVNKMWFPEVC